MISKNNTLQKDTESPKKDLDNCGHYISLVRNQVNNPDCNAVCNDQLCMYVYFLSQLNDQVSQFTTKKNCTNAKKMMPNSQLN